MATLQEKVEAYTGAVSDVTLLDEWLKEEAINFISVIPLRYLYQFREWVDASTDLSAGRFLNKVRLDDGDGRVYEAREVAYERLDNYLYDDSLYYATNRNPVYAIANNLLYTAPENLVDGTESKILFISYPTPSYDDSSISGYPLQLEEYVVLGASIKHLVNIIYTGLEGITSLLPTAPSAPSFSYTDIDGSVTTAASIDISGLSLPTYTKPISEADFTIADAIINTEEDIELAQAELAQQNSILNEYGSDIANETKEFEKEFSIYKLQVQEQFENARMLQQKLLDYANRIDNIELANSAKALESQISEYMAKIQLYQSELQAYQTNTSSVLSQIDRHFALLLKLKELKLEVLQTYFGQFNQGKEK